MAIPSLTSYIAPGIKPTPQPGTVDWANAAKQSTRDMVNAQGSGYAYDPSTNSYISSNQGGVGGGYFRSSIGDTGGLKSTWVQNPIPVDPTDMALTALRKIQGSGVFGNTQISGGGFVPPAQVKMRSFMAGPDAFGAQNAAFAGVKARAGSLARSGLETLRANLAERGILGGGTEARDIVSKLAEAINPESDYNTAALGENVKIAQQNQALDAAAAGQQYSGDVSQRGQDIGVMEAAQNRNLDIAKWNASQNQAALMGLLSAYSKMSY